MDEVKQTFKDKGRGRSTSRNYGICYNEERIIYVNTNNRKRKHRQYKGIKYTETYTRQHKTTYKDILHTLVHELVHYRFNYLQHGAKYEKRIREILGGRVFPSKNLFEQNNDTSQPSDKSLAGTEGTTTIAIAIDEANHQMLMDDFIISSPL